MNWLEEAKQKAELRMKQASSRKARSGAIHEGKRLEQSRIIKIAESQICFEHHKGCNHASCYAIGNLIMNIKETK